MVDRMLFCPICGGPIRPPVPNTGGVWRDDIKWQTETVLLHDPESEFEQLEQHYRGGKYRGVEQANIQINADIRQDNATTTWSNTCVVKETGQEIAPNWLAGFDEFNIPYNIPYSIAVHKPCVDIAVKVMRRSQNDIRVRSLRTLWKVIRTRFDARDNEYMGTIDKPGPQYLVMDHGYYMPLGFADDYSIWEGDDAHWVVTNPTEVPQLTARIIANTKVFEPQSANPSARDFGQLFLSLPQELRDRVISFMGCFEGLSTHCTGLLPQNTWLDILLDGRYLPFLWDLDTVAVEKFFDVKAKEGVEMNWELLVRELSNGVWSTWRHHNSLEAELEIFCYPNLIVPNGLRNRRRIWQLIEEMYVGDVLPVRRSWVNSKQIPTMPRYWDEYGDPAYPVVRVAGILEED
ncbi:hypothetical protein BKA67DRAFT_656226 [Truncatella angustata]|uniref:Uncharacterized protein n=1 Tax=Truncatella angustata TaxID=152316 RepID=A0A9P9A1E1_9PEZI|nr:uncharacterized protein BKA67DRAFT_656226 [Truncatella angustata]KAH6657994.1 hypothetical protein BKA67DRAFT_656226 [Truncatella angustata]KAH8195190.1 hypothetical protein TruAng_010633 [Truncatella angustata]